MKIFNGLALFGLLLSTSSLFSYDSENGKDLYYEAQCQKCHTEADYTSQQRKVNDFARLQWRVQRCDFSMDAGWFDEDIDDVVHYLNDSFYKFSTDKIATK